MNNPFSNNDTGLIKLPETKKELFRRDENWSCDMPLPLRLLRLADQNHYLNTLWNYLKYSHSPLCSRISRLEITAEQELLWLEVCWSLFQTSFYRVSPTPVRILTDVLGPKNQRLRKAFERTLKVTDYGFTFFSAREITLEASYNSDSVYLLNAVKWST